MMSLLILQAIDGCSIPYKGKASFAHLFIVTCPPVLPELLEIATVHEVASSSDLSTIWEWPGNEASHVVHVLLFLCLCWQVNSDIEFHMQNLSSFWLVALDSSKRKQVSRRSPLTLLTCLTLS